MNIIQIISVYIGIYKSHLTENSKVVDPAVGEHCEQYALRCYHQSHAEGYSAYEHPCPALFLLSAFRIFSFIIRTVFSACIGFRVSFRSISVFI